LTFNNISKINMIILYCFGKNESGILTVIFRKHKVESYYNIICKAALLRRKKEPHEFRIPQHSE